MAGGFAGHSAPTSATCSSSAFSFPFSSTCPWTYALL